MTALELHGKHPDLELAPVLRIIKYLGLQSNALSAHDVERILSLYPHFESDPELIVGIDAVCHQTGLDAESLAEILELHRDQIPFLGTAARPMVPVVALRMIRALADGDDPIAGAQRSLYTLTEMAERTGISLASLSKYVKDFPERIPSHVVGKMRKFPAEAIAVFQQIKTENLGKRGGASNRVERQKAAVSRRYAVKLAELEAQVEAAVEASRELAGTLNRLARQIKRARAVSEAESRLPSDGKIRPRRSGGQRPNTIVAACRLILAEAGEPMRVADITDRVIALGTPVKAKNPNVTVSSILSSYDEFRRVRRGYYELVGPAPLPRADSGRDESLAAEPDATPGPERDPSDVLAELKAAADSAETGREAFADAADVALKASGTRV